MGEIGQIPNHQVKVDNWPLFFLQRLHHFYRKKSHCDLTLLFSTLDTIKSIKVHRLVLHACTDYFESLDIMKDSEHGEFLQLSNEMHPDVVIPIISFMYTGKLEFPVTLQPRLYEAATKLRMTILTKLLDVQPNRTTQKVTTQTCEEPVPKISIIPNEVPSQTPNVIENNQNGNDFYPGVEASQISSNYSSPSSSKQVEEPVVTLMPVSMMPSAQKQSLKPDVTYIQRTDFTSVNNQNKAKVTKKNLGLQFTAVTPKPKVVDVSLPPTLPGRKLPVWKRKVVLTGSQSDNVQNVRSSFRPVETPKPTRFEWDEDLNDPTVLRSVEDAPKILSHDGTTKITHPIILDGDMTTPQKDILDDSTKRCSDGSSSDSPPYKRSRSDLQDMKEYGKQQQLRNEIICSEENTEDMMDTDDLYGPCDDESDDLTNFSSQSTVNSLTPKPILKTVSKPESPMGSKRVRFSLEGKENNQQQNEAAGDFTTVAKQPVEPVVPKQKIVLPMNVNQISSGKHHVKIVSEVLKKYPNLAKRDNIKLRVVSKNPAAVPPTVQHAVEGEAGGGNKPASSLVSYIFLTNKSSSELLPVKTETNEKDKLFDVENKTGPWFCQVCNEANPITFDSYYTYRRHLVEVHELKIDARICEYCGLKNSKRNHLLYHLYTKHGINPPAHVSFPKCSECDYIALSDALLVKHKSTHDPKGMACYACNDVFKSWCKHSHPKAEGTPQNTQQREGKQIYRCPYCEALYEDGDKLGKHIVSIHWGKNSQVSNVGTNADVQQPQSGQQLQYTEQEENSVEVEEATESQPSSDLESLSNVASGIATSLGLVGNDQAVMYYEQRTADQDIGGEATVVTGDECKDYVISVSSEDMETRECQTADDNIESVTIENDDSNSRTSNTEEVNPTSCSDHDYSEPQTEENFRHIIPVHQVANPMPENQVIQQILPDQKLVFSNQANVVFQPSCVSLPQRVLLTSGKMVLPQIAHPGQNVILSQVIPQTRIILSSPILQQTEGIIDDGGGTIVFANPDPVDQKGDMQMVQYPIQNVEGIQEERVEESTILEDMNQQMQDMQEKENEEEENEEEEKEEEEKEVENSEGVEQVNQPPPEPTEDMDEVQEQIAVPNTKVDDTKTQNRVETSKIVDDWDESNENQQNVESRSDGPSRPEFF